MTTESPANGQEFHRPGILLANEEFAAKVQQNILNAQSMQTDFLRRRLGAMDQRRNLENDCGYPEGTVIDPWTFRDLYDREPVATRVVELMPKECWQVQPEVSEDEDTEDDTPFEAAWEQLSKQLRGDSSWFQDSEGSPVFEYLGRVDKLSGIGSYGVLLLGFDDGRALFEPVEGMVTTNPTNNYQARAYSDPVLDPSEYELSKLYEAANDGKPLTINVARPPESVTWNLNPSTSGVMYKTGSGDAPQPVSSIDSQYLGVQFGPTEYPSTTPSTKSLKLVFLRPFDQTLVQVTQWESNMRSPRFGQPVMYRITLNDPREMTSGIGAPMATVQVHWTRLIHVSDNRNANDWIGVSRLRPVLNPILDIRKIRGACGEGYWKAGIPGIALSTHPQLGGDVPVDQASMKSMMENYFNSGQRDLLLVGMNATTLTPNMIDPTPYVNVMVEAVCIQLGCPVRVFRGSERGELASSQDDSSWNDRLRHRQNSYLTPWLIVPFVDRLIMCGVLPAPTKGRDKPLKAKPKSAPPPQQLDSTTLATKNHYGRPYRNAEDQAKADEGAAQEEGAKRGKSFGEVRGGYSVKWPDLDSLGEKDKAVIAQGYTTALAAFVSGGCENAMEFKDYLVHVWEMDEETAQNIIDNAIRGQEEKLDAHADMAGKAEKQDLVKTPPVGFENKPEPPPPMPGTPGGPPASPFTVRPGDKAVHPQTGKTIAQGNPQPKPAGAVAKLHTKRSTKNEEDRVQTWNTLKDLYEQAKSREETGAVLLNALVRNFVDGREVTTNDTAEGQWITYQGQHFLVKDGEIMSGHLKGQKMSDVGKSKADPHGGLTGDRSTDSLSKADLDREKAKHAGDKTLYRGPVGAEKEKQDRYAEKQDKYLRKQLGLGKKEWRKVKEKMAENPGVDVMSLIGGGKKVKNAELTPRMYDEEREDDQIAVINQEEWPAAFGEEELVANSADSMEEMSVEQLEEYLESLDEDGEDLDDGELAEVAEEGMVDNSNPEGHNQYTDNPSSQEPQGHMEKLRAIGDRFTKTDELSHAEMKNQVDAALSGLTGKQLKEVAEAHSASSAKGRKERVEAVKRSMQDRREMYKRTQRQ